MLKRVYGGFWYLQVKNPHTCVCGFFGAAIRIRTGDLILTKDALYRLSYSSICFMGCCFQRMIL